MINFILVLGLPVFFCIVPFSCLSIMDSLKILRFLFPLISLSMADMIPRALSWSSKTYGPDGPWHATNVQIGTPPQSVDLFPGGFWQSNILSSTICDSVSPQTCNAPRAGLYDPDASGTTVALDASFGGNVDNGTFSDKGMLSLIGSGNIVFDSLSIVTEDPPSASVQYPDFDMLVISQGSELLPDGTKYEIEVGNLALGAPSINQTWGDVNGSLVPGHLFLTGQIPSNSFGMHIGSTALKIPPSLYLGGYDQTKVIGQVTAQKYDMHFFPIDLLDIGMGVAEGESPFPFTSKSGLLASGNSSIGVAMRVIVDPIAPFIYLPKSSCDAIAAHLPVKYQPSLGLYFWDTGSKAYHTIISSPSFLSFTFRYNSSVTQNMTINVPFSLLNLTLAPPLATTPTQYFPCNSFDYGKSYSSYTLGKAFLQAAFLGVNWKDEGNGNWFLAQAPGPNTPSAAAVQPIGVNDTSIAPSTNNWADTWKGTWTPITSSKSSNPTTAPQDDSKSSKSGISTGAIIGIAIGCAIVVILALVAAVLYWKRRKGIRNSQEKGGLAEQGPQHPAEMPNTAIPYWELGDDRDNKGVGGRPELSGTTHKVELPG